MLSSRTINGLTLQFESEFCLSAPRVVHQASGEILVDYWGTGWFGTASLDHRGRLKLWIRRDRSDVLGHVVVIDHARGSISRDYGHGRVAVQRPACMSNPRATHEPVAA